MEKITYASLGSLGESFHERFDRAVESIRAKRPSTHTLYLNGRWTRKRDTIENLNPANSSEKLGRFSLATRGDLDGAIAGARKAFPAWEEIGWKARVAAFMRRAAELMTGRQFELAAILSLEVGKNRVEAIAEVSEAIDLLLYYSDQLEEHRGFEIPLVTEGRERTWSLLRPYGVWAVVAPFNFPFALAAGMVAGALLGGNTVVFKPSSDTPWSGFCLAEILHESGLPPGVFNCIFARGKEVGDALMEHDGLDGIAFTGSREVGFRFLQQFRRQRPRPVLAEMGGKNPAIIMPSANLDDAAEGVVRSAFGMGGQKCSACSRLYVHRKIYSDFMQLLVEKTGALRIGDPVERETFLGPLINAGAVKKYNAAVRMGKKEGRLVYGGGPVKAKNLKKGFFVSPIIFDQLPPDSPMFKEEFFAPVLSAAVVDSLEEALNLSNDSEYGLTAGIFTQDPDEKEEFFQRIEAGVVYCNRRGGATTGAWPGVQSFGGWKSSGSTGKSALGPHYVAQFMREQSRTEVL